MIRYIPQILAIHPLDAMQPDEEFMLMEHAFMCAMDSYANVPAYTAWLAQQDQTSVYEYLKKMLQFLQWQKSGNAACRMRSDGYLRHRSICIRSNACSRFSRAQRWCSPTAIRA